MVNVLSSLLMSTNSRMFKSGVMTAGLGSGGALFQYGVSPISQMETSDAFLAHGESLSCAKATEAKIAKSSLQLMFLSNFE